MRTGTEKSASVYDCVRCNRHDVLGMSLDENRFSMTVPSQSSVKMGSWPVENI